MSARIYYAVESLSESKSKRAKETAVCGPVRILSKVCPCTVLLVSIAGINFEYSIEDIREFVLGPKDSVVNDNTIKIFEGGARNLGNLLKNNGSSFDRAGQWSPEEPLKSYRINLPKVHEQMQNTWMVSLQAMLRNKVEWAVLCALGCSAYRGPFPEVATLWAEALRDLL